MINIDAAREVVPDDLTHRVRNVCAPLDRDVSDLKGAINNFLWQQLPADMTLRQAERIACLVFAAMHDVGVAVRTDSVTTPQPQGTFGASMPSLGRPL